MLLCNTGAMQLLRKLTGAHFPLHFFQLHISVFFLMVTVMPANEMNILALLI